MENRERCRERGACYEINQDTSKLAGLLERVATERTSTEISKFSLGVEANIRRVERLECRCHCFCVRSLHVPCREHACLKEVVVLYREEGFKSLKGYLAKFKIEVVTRFVEESIFLECRTKRTRAGESKFLLRDSGKVFNSAERIIGHHILPEMGCGVEK